MEEYTKLNFLNGKEPEYYYEVQEYVTIFGKDKDGNDSFSNSEKFSKGSLLECKQKAVEYYQERLDGFEGGSYFLPFASPQNFIDGKNAAFSIDCFLVENYGYIEGYDEHVIHYFPTEFSGHEESEIQETLELEDKLFYEED